MVVPLIFPPMPQTNRCHEFGCIVWAALLGFASAVTCAAAPAEAPMKVRAVVVAMFEVGKDRGDTPGEFQLWVEREHLDKVYPLPAAYHDVLANEETGVIGIVTGEGTARAASTIMALGCDPRFDLTHAYWLVAGIAGIDPADASTGSAAWAEWVVDGDLAHEIDPREMPKDWTSGFIPLEGDRPYPQPKPNPNGACNVVYHLNAQAHRVGVPAHEGHPAARQRKNADQPRAVQGFAQRAEAAVRAEGRHAFVEHVLAREIARRLGE